MYNPLIVRIAVVVCIFAAFFFGWVASYFNAVVQPTEPLVELGCVAATIVTAWTTDRLLD